MPLYEYICRNCNSRSELLVRSHRDRPVCMKCGSDKLERQLSTFAAHSNSGKPSSCPAGDVCPADACQTGRCPLA